MADRRPRLPDPRARASALYGIGAVALRRRARGRRDWVDVRPPRGLRARRRCSPSRSRSSRSRSCARTSPSRSSRRTRRRRRRPSTRPPPPGPRRRARCCCGCWLLSLWSSLVLFLTRRRMRDVAPYATAVLLGFGAFFCGLLVFAARPFDDARRRRRPRASGLNPLLRHPSMMIHPPMLYSGYTLFAIPFAFAVGALVARRVDAEWIRATRRFALAAWLFLGIGILLGARWSYAELGWGGYWAWDPVENASLMPWLTGTAFLHSMMIQEKRGMLKIWNVSLVLATGMLAILGTFLVRSGILDSIHAFGASTLGVPVRVAHRGADRRLDRRSSSRARDTLRSEHRLDSLLSREAVFLLNNLVLVGAVLRGLLGHVLPADLRGGHRRQGVGRAAVVRPLHRAAGARARAAVGHRAGDRLAAGDAGERCGATSSCPSPRAVGDGRRAARRRRSRSSPPSALAMFAFAAFVLAAVVPGVRGAACARGGRWPARPARRAGRRSCAATAAATAATSSTSAWRCCSSASPRRRPSSTRATSRCARARRRASAATTSATCGRRRASAPAPASSRRSASARCSTSARTASTSRRCARARLLPVAGRATSGPVGRFFDGEATSEVGLRAGPAPRRVDRDAARHLDAAPVIDEGDKAVRATDAQAPADAQARSSARRSRRSSSATRDAAAAGDVPPASSRRW